LEVGAIIEGG